MVDIGGAFLNAEMKTGVDTHMRLYRTISDLMVRLSPGYESYRDVRGCIVVQLDRALYGCVESAALWYDNLRETMEGMGYKRNPYDICVFNRTSERGVQCTAAVHVDDLLITSVDEDMITSLTVGLKTRYGEISETRVCCIHGRDKRVSTVASGIMQTKGSNMRSPLTKGSADSKCGNQKRPQPQRGNR